jgi:hypothetical protein
LKSVGLGVLTADDESLALIDSHLVPLRPVPLRVHNLSLEAPQRRPAE